MPGGTGKRRDRRRAGAVPDAAGLVGEEVTSLVVAAGAGAGRAAGLGGDADVNAHVRVVRAGRGGVWWGAGPWAAKRRCHHAPSSPQLLCVSTECLLVVSRGQGLCLLHSGFPEPLWTSPGDRVLSN